MRPATSARLGLLTIAALLVPAFASANWDTLFRTHLSIPQGMSSAVPARIAVAIDAATGDLNGDGLPDIAVANTSFALNGGGYAQESGGAEIVALGACYEADFANDRIVTPNLTLEGSSIAAFQ